MTNSSETVAALTEAYLKALKTPFPPRRIGVDIQTLEHWETGQRGIGRYTIAHVTALAHLFPQWDFVLFSKSDPAHHFGAPLLSLPKFSWMQVGKERDAGLDLYHIPDQMSLLPNYIPPLQLAPKTIPATILFHDLIPLILREAYLDTWSPEHQRFFLHRLEMITASHAFILTNSECTKKDLVRLGNVPSCMVEAIMAGSAVPASFAIDEKRFVELGHRLGITGPFLLFVGGGEEHKGITTAIQAWLSLKPRYPNLQIVFAGSAGDPWKKAFKEHLEQNQISGAIFTGYLADNELWDLYANTLALLFPSHYEGFGFPVLEALKLGAPVIASNVASIPEIVGKAGLLHAPNDVAAFSESIEQLLLNEPKRASLIADGKKQAEKFRWEAIALRTGEIWEELINGKLPDFSGTLP